MVNFKDYYQLKYKKFRKILKNKKNFLKNIWLSYIIDYHITYLSYMKINYFLIIYKVFFKFYRYIRDKKIFLRRKIKADNGFKHIYGIIYKKHSYTKFIQKFKIFNYYYLFLNIRVNINSCTIFSLFPKVRNFFLTISRRGYRKIWSVGMFLTKFRLKYKMSAQKVFIKFFLDRVQLKITKNIMLNISTYTKKNKLFLNQIKWKINYLNKKLYKFKYLKFKRLKLSIKFKFFSKKTRKKPNKKKSMRKRHHWYIY